jgi:hypothetical protein
VTRPRQEKFLSVNCQYSLQSRERPLDAGVITIVRGRGPWTLIRQRIYRDLPSGSVQSMETDQGHYLRSGDPWVLPMDAYLSGLEGISAYSPDRRKLNETAGRRSAVSGLQRRASGVRPGLVSSVVVVRSLGGECRVRVLKQGGSLRGLWSCDSSGTYDWRPLV